MGADGALDGEALGEAGEVAQASRALDRLETSEQVLMDAGYVGAADDRRTVDGGDGASAASVLDGGVSTDSEAPFHPEGDDDELPTFFAGGRGCVNADTHLTWAPDKRSLRIVFDRLIAEVVPGELSIRSTNICNLILPVESGQQTFAIKSIKTTIESNLPGDVRARLDLMPGHSIGVWTAENGDSRRIEVPSKGQTTIVSDLAERLAFLPCRSGESPQLTLVALAALTQEAPYMSSGTLKIHSMELELARRACPPK